MRGLIVGTMVIVAKGPVCVAMGSKEIVVRRLRILACMFSVMGSKYATTVNVSTRQTPVWALSAMGSRSVKMVNV